MIDNGGIIIGIIALIGSLHYALANDLLRDLSEIGARILSRTAKTNKKEKTILIEKCRKVLIFLAISNHTVELVFTFLFGYCLFGILVQTNGEQKQKIYLIPSHFIFIIIIILAFAFIYVFKRAFRDFERIKEIILKWFPRRKDAKCYGRLLNCLFIIFILSMFGLLAFYCYSVNQLLLYNRTEIIKRFFIITTVISFGVWWFSFKLRPLTMMFEVRQVIFSKKCPPQNVKIIN